VAEELLVAAAIAITMVTVDLVVVIVPFVLKLLLDALTLFV